MISTVDTELNGKPGWPPSSSFSAALTSRTPKMTIPSPTILHLRSGANLAGRAYPNLNLSLGGREHPFARRACRACEVGIRWSMEHATFRRRLELEHVARGERPRTRSPIVNAAFTGGAGPGCIRDASVPRQQPESGGAEGGYDPVADTLFNKINVDSYLLEYDTARAGSFEPLRFVPKNKTVVLGLVGSSFPNWNPRRCSSGASTRPPNISTSTSWVSARNAASRARRPATRSRSRTRRRKFGYAFEVTARSRV